MQTEGLSRSHTTDFKKIRTFKRTKQKQRFEKILIKFQRFSHLSATQKPAPKSSFWRRSSSSPSLLGDEDAEDINQAKSCSICKAIFDLTRLKKFLCPICQTVVCNNDFGRKLPLEPPATGEVECCRKCFLIVKTKENREEFLKHVEKAKHDELSLMYNTLISIKSSLLMTIPTLRGLVYSMIEVKKMVEQTKNSKNSAGMVDVAALFDLIEQATQMRDKMRRDFAGLDSRIKKIDTLQYLVSDDGVKLKKNLHYMLVQFLQMNLPEFRFLDRQLDTIVNNQPLMKYLKELEVEQKTKKSQAANNKPSTEPKKKPANNSGNSTRTSGESTVKITGNYVSDKEPIITNVIPCICPLQGGNLLTVKGQEFDRGAQILINGLFVEQRAVRSIELDKDVCQIKFICPKQRVEGPAVLEIRNSNGLKFSLHDVLMFIDDPALTEAFKEQEAEELNEISNNTEIGETYDFESNSPKFDFEEDWFKDRPVNNTNTSNTLKESQEKNPLSRSGSQSMKIERKANNSNNYSTIPGPRAPSYSPSDSSPTKISPRSVPVSPMVTTRSAEVQFDRPELDMLVEQMNIESAQSSHRRTNSSGAAVSELPVSRKWGRK
jgi:hypothetical protein